MTAVCVCVCVFAVVQQRGLFNDPVAEINSLVHMIKQEMQDLNAELDASQVCAHETLTLDA